MNIYDVSYISFAEMNNRAVKKKGVKNDCRFALLVLLKRVVRICRHDPITATAVASGNNASVCFES